MTENPEIFDLDEALEQEIQRMTNDDLITRTRLLDNDTLNFLNALSAERLADHDGNLRKYSPALYGG